MSCAFYISLRNPVSEIVSDFCGFVVENNLTVLAHCQHDGSPTISSLSKSALFDSCILSISTMRSLYNKKAMRVTVVYALLIVGLLIWTAYSSDSEGRALPDFIFGYPWVMATGDSPDGVMLFVALNAVSLYFLILIYIETFRYDDSARQGKQRPNRKP